MSFIEWLIGWLYKKPPGRVTNIKIRTGLGTSMRTVTVTWDIATVREDNKPLPKTELQFTEVFLATIAANGTVGTFASLAKVAPDATQTVNQDMPDGKYRFRFIETDTFNKKGQPADADATITSAPPGKVTNIQITVA